jgi:hypothetical protein
MTTECNKMQLIDRLARCRQTGGMSVDQHLSQWSTRRLPAIGRGILGLAIGLMLSGAAPRYEQDVRPLLKRRCLSCHGEQPELAGGLDLRLRRTLVAGGDSGPAVVPEQPTESLLIRLVTAGEMPPGDARDLSAEEIDLLRRWISAGANVELPEPEQLPLPGEPFFTVEELNHWSLRTISAAERPSLNASGALNRLDTFIAARLAEHGLSFAPEADRRTLIRRLYFDLLGLPPSPEEIDRFLADETPAAWERLVDQVLASPHYGERWARHWLDVVHFGETHGYDKDQPRPNAWPYRDYVVRALNEDKPYSRFVQEQLAGDVLFSDTRDGIEALGFIAAGPWDQIGHKEVPETKIDGQIARHLDRDDMVQNTLVTFCSLTVGCAQCHDHKFDPIPQSDYYALQAVFAAVDRTDRPYDADPAIARERQSLLTRQRRLAARDKELDDQITELAGPELTALLDQITTAEKPRERPPEYGYHSAIADRQDVEKWVQVDFGEPRELSRLRLLACDDDFNSIGPGFGFPVRFRIDASDDPEFSSGVVTLVDRTRADQPNPRREPTEFSFTPVTSRYVRLTATRLASRKSDYILALAELELFDAAGVNVARGCDVTALDSIEAPVRWRKSNLVDGLAPSPRVDPAELQALRQKRDDLLAVKVPEDVRNDMRQVRSQLSEIKQRLAQLPKPLTTFTGSVHDGSGNFRGTGPDGGRPRTIYVLGRGDVTNPGRESRPGALSCIVDLPSRFELPAAADEGARRAALANWITNPRNPLTWRSIVNRVWQYHFGRGLVETSSDFGRMGATPTHQELLDWLAAEFRDGEQSLKDLHRLILTSRTWKQASRVDDQAALARGQSADQENRLLWRMPRRQLDAESVRDSLLEVAGRLNREMGGASFRDFVIEKPEHSPHYQYHLHDPDDPASHRRSVYRFLVRSQTQPFMTVLDCADPSMLVDRRNETVSPLQALTLLNSGLSLTMSRHFAERLRAERESLADQVERGLQLTLGRPGDVEEIASLTDYAGQHGLEQTCRLLLNLNEFLFVD